MKQILLFTVLLSGQHLFSQGCSELFISEYLEGTGNNKGVEIYNPTSNDIDLAPYTLERWSNGENASSDEANLVGTIPAYGTWVLINGQTEDVDLGGGNISPFCDPAMQALSDQLDDPYPAPTYMNGNDALLLLKGGTEVLDIFGKPGENPGVAWTDNADAGYTDSDGGTWLTANHTLRRKYDIEAGVSLPPLEFNTLLEYDSLPNETWDGLGWHNCACDPNSIANIQELISLNIFPNPSENGIYTINVDKELDRIEVYSQNGKLIRQINNQKGIHQFILDLNDQATGTYIANFYFGKTVLSKTLIHR